MSAHAGAEHDDVSIAPLVRIATASLVLFVAGVALTTLDLQRRTGWVRAPGPDPLRSAIDRPTIGIVNLSLFRRREPGPDERARDRKTLETYGWVDREAGVIRIPIDRAIDLVAEEPERAP